MDQAANTNTKMFPVKVCLLASLMVVLVYCLSVGPVLVTADRFHLGGTRFFGPLRAFYAPIFAVARSSDAGTRAYESYVGLWCHAILNQSYPHGAPRVSVESLLASIGTITNGQTAFKILVPSELSMGGVPTERDYAMGPVIAKIREHELYLAGFKEVSGGRLYTFEHVRSWEKKQ
jgi:hypothetical protein